MKQVVVLFIKNTIQIKLFITSEHIKRLNRNKCSYQSPAQLPHIRVSSRTVGMTRNRIFYLFQYVTPEPIISGLIFLPVNFSAFLIQCQNFKVILEVKVQV